MKKSPFLQGFNPYSMAPSIISRLSSHFQKIVAQTVRPLDLIVAEWRILATLATFGTNTVNEIVLRTRLPQSTISRSIKRLEGKGLVRITKDRKDNRFSVIDMTQDGLEKCEIASREITRCCDEILNELQEKLTEIDVRAWLSTAKEMNNILSHKSL